jgi:hypothetical protein
VGATAQVSKQGIPSFGPQLSGHEFSEIYYPSAFRLFVPPLKNLAEKEDLPSVRFPTTSVVAGVEKPGASGGRRLVGATVQLEKQGIPSFGQLLSGHEFSGIYYPSAFRLFVPPLKNSAEKEDLLSTRFPISSVVLRLHVGQHIFIWR